MESLMKGIAMPDRTPQEELTELRAQIRRLQSREAALALEVEGTGPAPLRPGWPIRRMVTPALH